MLKKILLYIFIAVIFYSFGFITPEILKKNKNTDCGSQYQAGWAAAKARLYDTGASFERITLGYDVRSVYGTVEKLEDNKLTVKIKPVEPLADPDLDIRFILIDKSTEIIKYFPETDRALNIESSDGEINYSRKNMSTIDMKPGTSVVIHVNHDIAYDKEFVADEIVILEN